MIFSARELCDLEPETFQIRQIETEGTLCSLFYASGRNIVHSNKAGPDPFAGLAFSCKKETHPRPLHDSDDAYLD